MVKLTRRSFLGLLSAIPFAPLVAKDLGDFEFLPPMAEVLERPITVAMGALRYNEYRSQFEVYTNHGWEVIATMEEKQNA